MSSGHSKLQEWEEVQSYIIKSVDTGSSEESELLHPVLKACRELVQSLLISWYYPSELDFVVWDQRTLSEAELEGRMNVYLHSSLGSHRERMVQNGNHGQ